MKKGSLSLSVNAIVVFILAFAMLGVGIYFVNIIRDNIGSGALAVFDANELPNPPTADKPITMPTEITIKGGATEKYDIGFYNVGPDDATDATPVIKACYGDGNTTDEAQADRPFIISSFATVPKYESKAFPIKIKTSDDLESNKTWVCTLEMQKSRTPSIVYESTSFFFNVGN
ncbi:hypothetical protein JW868_02975 [Candidatus Woesearchaeota archaeon]|nr:hypothetical protein [Candidatus Woesearchaeota archaeon]